MIFGLGKSYIIQGVNTITLRQSIVTPDFFQNQDKEFTSIINGNKTHTHLGDYSEFKVLVYLWRESNPSTKLSSLLVLRNQSFDFYLYGTTVIATCYAETITPLYFRDRINYDAVVLNIVPLHYTAISQYILDEKYIPILDEDGNKILAEGFTII